ncbi:MAG TPA: serine/threonine-protein kinase, partial [Gemmataceae bacterium]|nr:serine/threonine-protein kinase [Gemmataceae bacterium]
MGADERALLDALVQKHLQRHGNDPQKSLAAVSSIGSVREQIQQFGDAEMHASLAHVSAARDEGADPFVTQPPTVGTPTSAGLRFRILRPHARGGLGEVFVAHDGELHREVALKEVQDRYADDPHSRARFLLEAEITGGLEHPGIVPVYGLGTYADGRPFYAMRFIRGDSLRDAIERFHQADVSGRHPGERSLALRGLLGRFVDVCDAVAYAHSRGVLHRDLKPGNVMLGQYGETLVVDWGLAKPVGAPAGEQTAAERPLQPAAARGSAPTQMGSAVGTPAYMPPEQAAGRLDELGPPSDVYSLGATLYCLLTGKAPFEGPDVGAVLRKVQRGDFPPPRRVKRGVPQALEAVCLKAMALKPEGRYPSPRALAADVEHWLADEPVGAWREPWSVRARRWLGRHRTLVTAGVAALVVAAVSLGVATALLEAANERERAAREEERNQAAAAATAQANAERERVRVQALLSQQYVSKGSELIEQGDLLGALPWYTEALLLDRNDPER